MWLLAEGQAANALMLAGVALASGVLLFRSQRRLRQQAASQPLPPSAWRPQAPIQPSASTHVKAPAEAESWHLEFHELAREASARLDNKIRILEHLIRDADARIAQLQSVGEWLDRSATLETETAAAPGIVLSKLSAGDRDRGIAWSTACSEPAAAHSPALAARPYEEIYALADAGCSNSEIAGRLNSPVGEIELILGLRGQR